MRTATTVISLLNSCVMQFVNVTGLLISLLIQEEKFFNKNLMKTKEGFYIHWKKDVINSIKWIQETQIEGPIIFLMEDL